MKRASLVGVIAVLVLVAAGYWWWSRGAGEKVALDMVEAFRGAEKRSNVDVNAAFAMDPQTIGGVTRPAIYMHPTSRVIYHDVEIPADGRLLAFLAIKDEVYDKGTDGVYFRIGVSTGTQYEDLLKRQLDPFRVPADRGWVPVSVDLSKYAGQKVQVIFNTEPSLPGHPPHSMYDFAVIGAPRIVAAPQS